MSEDLKKEKKRGCGFDFEPVGHTYPRDTRIIYRKDGTISLKPPKKTRLKEETKNK